MSKHLRTLAVGATIVAGLAAAPALDAQDDLRMPEGSMMGRGGMIGSMMSGMRNMMGMSAGMDEHCNEMMQSMMGQHDNERPNEQWRRGEPAPQDDLRSGASRG